MLFGKILDEQQRKCMVWDIERCQRQHIELLPWQTDTCIGNWHYEKALFDRHRYKSATTFIRTLADVVSKNGNLLLSVPVKADGTIDSDEQKIVEGIAAWMDVNRESIFGTRPWKVFGEGPQADSPPPINAQGLNEGKTKPATNADMRYTAKGDSTIYEFYVAGGSPDVCLCIATGEQRIYANLLLTIGVVRQSRTSGGTTRLKITLLAMAAGAGLLVGCGSLNGGVYRIGVTRFELATSRPPV